MKKGLKSAGGILNALGIVNATSIGRIAGGKIFKKAKAPKEPKMNLTKHELDTMAGLHGKAKKKYIKELKANYGI